MVDLPSHVIDRYRLIAIRVRRNVYIVNHVRGNIYQQIRALSATEIYDVAMINGLSLYIGRQGAFILLDNLDDLDRVNNTLNTLL
jgi:hypothetical protein